MGVKGFLRKEQMNLLQNFENLAIIVSKAFGGESDKKKPSGKNSSFEEIQAVINEINS